MKNEDLERIVFYHLSPINVSVHTTDMELRKKMLNNRFADQLMEKLDMLAKAGIEMNFQIVLCRGINDGKVLDKSISDLSRYYPHGQSLSVVPIGLTRYRSGLYPMTPFDKESSRDVIKLITKWQKKLKKEIGSSFVFIADEFYLNAQMKFPKCEEYEDFPQIENGVGMISLMENEFNEYLSGIKSKNIKRKVSLATGTAAYEFIKKLSKSLEEKFNGLKINVYAINNDFFGGKISVSGLLTGRDIIKQLTGKDLGEFLCLPKNLLRSGETVLLDDMDISDIEKNLNIKIRITGDSGSDFIKAIID
jgi:putative radical SAM enzyme (TIGR03279 family)